MRQRVISFEKLRVYHQAFSLQQQVLELSKGWPREEQCAFIDQARRASRSIDASISDARAKRCHRAYFISSLTDALWLRTAGARHFLTAANTANLATECDTTGGKLGRMIVDTHL